MSVQEQAVRTGTLHTAFPWSPRGQLGIGCLALSGFALMVAILTFADAVRPTPLVVLLSSGVMFGIGFYNTIVGTVRLARSPE